MDVKLVDEAVTLVKQREGILNSIQDKYISAIVNGVISELERDYHIKADLSKMDIFMFVVDLSAYRYSNRDSLEGLPKNLEFRLRNLYIQECNNIDETQVRRPSIENKDINIDNPNKSVKSIEPKSIEDVVREIDCECRGSSRWIMTIYA